MEIQPRTHITVTWGAYDPDAKAQATFKAHGDIAEFVDPDLREFKRDVFNPPKVATMEQDYWSGDGTWQLFPDRPNFDNQRFGLWSRHVCKEDMTWDNGVWLSVDFATPRSSVGITLRFDLHKGIYPAAVQVDWFKDNSEIDTMIFYPDAPTYFCDHLVRDYNKVHVTPLRAKWPNTYAKITGIDFGLERNLSPELIEARILEDVNTITDELRVSTCEVKFIDESISILGTEQLDLLFRQRQSMLFSGSIDGQYVYMGTFYLQSWENGTNHVHTMRGQNLIGLLDSVNFDGGIYHDKNVHELVSEIFTAFDPNNEWFDMDTFTATRSVEGWLPIMTCRQALQQVIFLTQALVDANRSHIVNIYTAPTSIAQTIGATRRSLEQTIYQDDIVDGVEVISHTYSQSEHSEEIVLIDADLAVGEHRIEFTQPIYGIQVDFTGGTGNTLKEYTVNYMILDIVAADYVYATGFAYVDTQQRFTRGTTEGKFARNVITVENGTLISPNMAPYISQWVYDYYSQRYINEFSYRTNPEEEPGQLWQVAQADGRSITGRVETMETDLVGGFISTVQVRGGVTNA